MTCLDHEEEVVAVEVNTISELGDAFLLSKGLDSSKALMLQKKYVMNFYHLLKLINIKQILFLKIPSCKGTVTFGKNNGVTELLPQISSRFVI